ncbi:MAG: type IV pilin protein [Candidatus Rifleibacteriota bacterium]
MLLNSKGFSLIELVTVLAILLALSYFALPSMELTFVRSREKLLHQRLTEIRSAIDKFTASRNDAGGSVFPPSVASLGVKIPDSLLKIEANSGPFLDINSIGNPFTDGGESFLWDIRSADGTWHLDQNNPRAQLDVYDVRFPKNGVGGWKKAMDGTLYEKW